MCFQPHESSAWRACACAISMRSWTLRQENHHCFLKHDAVKNHHSLFCDYNNSSSNFNHFASFCINDVAANECDSSLDDDNDIGRNNSNICDSNGFTDINHSASCDHNCSSNSSGDHNRSPPSNIAASDFD